MIYGFFFWSMWFFLAMATQCYCEDKKNDLSLMFSETEQEALQEALENTPAEPLPDKVGKNCIRVDGIVFCSPLEWTVWINGTPYHAHQAQNSLFSIETVTSQTVTLKIKEKEITLYPNQVYDLNNPSPVQ